MALCVRVCWRLNEFEGIWRQDWLLSSGERALQGISLKKVNSLGSRVEQETLPSTRVLRRSGYMRAGSPESSLPGSRPCFPFSVDLPCCCCGCCCEEVALSKYKKKKLLAHYVRMSRLSNSYSGQTRSSIISRVTANLPVIVAAIG